MTTNNLNKNENNNINFQGSSYQPTQDKDFVKIMSDEFSTNHTTFSFTSRELFNSLYEAMLAREMPGMADVDSSLLLFCKEISKQAKVAVSRRMCRRNICRISMVF